MKKVGEIQWRPLAVAVTAIVAGSWQTRAAAQNEDEAAAGQSQADSSAAIEEVVAVGRFLSSSEQLVNERLDDASVTDVLGADSIDRLGDSTVAAALRRIPGLTLVSDKYVYVRGLGERYSQSTLNGAQIPSPDLTRNVIPLDVFPTSVVDSLRVQKAWSPNLSANFGGGSVDVRTHGIPDAFEFGLELGSGYNSINTGSAYTYPGGGKDQWGYDDGTRALSPAISSGINEFQGAVDVQGILEFLRRADSTATLVDAQAVNRSFGLALNRNIKLQEKDFSPDVKLRTSVGNKWSFNDKWELGFLLGGSYDTDWRKTTSISRNFVFPTERTDTEVETTQSVNISGNLNIGLSFTADHQINTTTLYLRNTDDETAVRDFFNENREISDGLGFRNYRFQYEERSMRTNQIAGIHYLGDATRGMFPGIFSKLKWVPTETRIDWHYSESRATTGIPNQVGLSSTTVTDPVTAAVLSEAVALQSTAADYRFTDLGDDVTDSGWSISLPFELDKSTLEIQMGSGHSQKGRSYEQSQFSLGPLFVSDPRVLRGSFQRVFSDTNMLDPANNFVFARQGTNNQSYLAATMTDHLFGTVDWTLNEKWRIYAGARWEDYRQAAVDWNPYGYSETSPQVTTDPDALLRGTFASDDIYPAVSFTYMAPFWADTFQLRLGWSQTAVRPDLREITDATYIDPITGDLVAGNSGVIPADIDNLDLRAEWFFANSDNFSVTLFNKDITNPIEFFESPASDTTIAREIINAESANVKGVEFEYLKELAFIGGIFDTMFLQGNLTLQDSELVAGPRADAPTNPVRPMTGASDYVANFMIGYDSRNAKHTASLIYNVFSERLYVAGRNGSPDGYEQPFNSLDFTYSWYPTDSLTFKAKAQNILGEKIEIERQGVLTFEEDPGTTYVLSVQWAL